MKLIALHGLPAAGKSTFSNEYVCSHPEFVIVSRDAIRAELNKTGWQWSRIGELRDVVPQRDRLIRQAFQEGHSVISDDTNIAKGALDGLAMLAHSAGASFEIVRFPATVDECIRRDALRPAPVGRDVIIRMAERLEGQHYWYNDQKLALW